MKVLSTNPGHIEVSAFYRDRYTGMKQGLKSVLAHRKCRPESRHSAVSRYDMQSSVLYLLQSRHSGGDMPEAHYVNPLGLKGSPQPFVCQNMNLYGFILEGDIAQLGALCDHWFNTPAGGQVRYVPLSRYVMLSFANLQRLYSQNPPFKDTFWMPEQEVSFWVLVAAVHRESSVWVADRLAWFNPYMFVDNPVAMIAGREVYGIPKQFGWFRMPVSGPPEDADFSLEAIGVTQFSADAEARRMPLLEVTHRGTMEGAQADKWESIEAAFEAIRLLTIGTEEIVLPGPDLVVNLIEGLIHREVQMVMLKQFPDIANGEYTAYQAIVEAPVTVTHYRGGQPIPAQYDLQLHPAASYPFATDLGLKLVDGRMQPKLAFWLNYDFELGTGREVWRADAPPPTPSGCLPAFLRFITGR